MYTVKHADENRRMRAAAKPALKAVGWQPDPEPRNWSDLAVNATYLVLRDFPTITFQRARHQVIAVMMAARGHKREEWNEVDGTR